MRYLDSMELERGPEICILISSKRVAHLSLRDSIEMSFKNIKPVTIILGMTFLFKVMKDSKPELAQLFPN